AQSAYRAYDPSATTAPGSPLAATNTSSTLGSIASDFRLRIGLTNLENSHMGSSMITANTSHTCAIGIDNKAYCWGKEGVEGRLGNGSTSGDQSFPVAVVQGNIPTGVTIRQIAAGSNHTCAV